MVAQFYLPGEATVGGAFVHTENRTAITTEEFFGVVVEQSTSGFDWFEDIHVIARSFSFGPPDGTTAPIEVFSAFRKDTHTWSSLTGGGGTVLTGIPGLPAVLQPLSGTVMTLDVSAVKSPLIDLTLTFTFTIGTILVSIEIAWPSVCR